MVMLSCREHIVDFEITQSQPRLVIGGLINSDSAMVIKISRTVGTLETDAKYGVKEAEVLLYENEKLVTELFYDANDPESDIDDIYVSEDGFVPSGASNYAIRVSADGYPSVRASTSFPKKIPIEEVLIDTALVQVGDFLNGVNARISFQDPAGGENFYSIVILEENRVYNEYNEYGEPIEENGFVNEYLSKPLLPRLDEKIEFNGKSNFRFKVLYLSDISFDGRLFTYDFLMHAPTGGKLTVFLNHITEAHYQYGTTSQLQQLESTENPFSQPVQVFSNVENGLGIFAGYSASSEVVEVL